MNCNNTYCLWNAFDQCCPESEELYNAATPNQLDCPSSLRSDHEESMCQIIDEVNEMMVKRNFRELAAIHSFVKNQRPQTSIQFNNGSKISFIEATDTIRGKGYIKFFE